MNLGKLKRILEREFKRNPAKTGVLLALLPIAAYVIGPMFWKMIPKKGSEQVATGTVKLQPAMALVQPSQQTIAKDGLAPWHQVAAKMAADSRMTSAAIVGLRNPFDREGVFPTQIAELAIEPDEDISADVNDSTGPEDYGLQLTATIVGTHLKLATINGKQYRENARLPILPSANGDGIAGKPDDAFVVQRVAKKYVVLERGGKVYQLKLSQ